MRVLITHPGAQYVRQLAEALYERGDLAGLWSGVPLIDASQHGRGWARLTTKLRRTRIPLSYRSHYPAFPILRRAVGHLRASPRLTSVLNHRLDHLFDRLVAKRIRRLRPEMVICYENSAMHTFRAAKKVGAVCVLDAASVHFEAGSKWMSQDKSDPEWVDQQKRSEIGLADAIITCSPLAADSYRLAGVEAGRLYSCPLGTDLPQLDRSKARPGSTFKFVFVGSLIRRKGVDLLLDVFDGFLTSETPVSLTLVGGVGEHDLLERARALPNVSHKPFLEQGELFEVVADHDCLVLPSRFDSFGMVVPEAMAVGVPALISDRVGAKCIIEEHPSSGWIVPLTVDSLRCKMLELMQSPGQVVLASGGAKVAAQDYTWTKYRQRVLECLDDIFSRLKHA